MRAYVGVTDAAWYARLAGMPDVDEVNFWRPGGGGFQALKPGEPFFFKTHYPHNRVVGGGFFDGFTRMTVSAAWDLFGDYNGVTSLQEMIAKIGSYRSAPIAPGEDPKIGCVLIRDVRFFPADETADAPPGFASNIVQGKGYDLSAPATASYFEDLMNRVLAFRVDLIDLGEPWNRPGPVYGDARLTPQRLGQRAFRAVVADAYNHRCAITDGKIRPVLQAAHVRPLPSGGEHRLDNGMLLRSDVHTLYDSGYLGVDPNHRLLVSPRLRTEFGNGEQFYAKAGQEIEVPRRRADRPAREFLEWHLDEVFQKS